MKKVNIRMEKFLKFGYLLMLKPIVVLQRIWSFCILIMRLLRISMIRWWLISCLISETQHSLFNEIWMWHYNLTEVIMALPILIKIHTYCSFLCTLKLPLYRALPLQLGDIDGKGSWLGPFIWYPTLRICTKISAIIAPVTVPRAFPNGKNTPWNKNKSSILMIAIHGEGLWSFM